jgi:hypothetical protein
LWRDQYVAVVSPERIALVRRRGWKGDYDLRADEAYGPAAPTAAAEALQRLVARPEIGRGDLTLLVTNHFVRYLLVPWRDEVASPAEFAAYADICYEQVYGGETAGRELRASPAERGSPRLAAALDAPFLAALRGAIAASRLRLVSVQPYLTAAFNRLSENFRHRDFLFVLAEPGRSCLLACAAGHLSSVRASANGDQPEVLAALIEREAQLLGLDEDKMPPVYVHAPRQARLRMPACHGVQPETLSLPIPAALAAAADHLLTMAMTVT